MKRSTIVTVVILLILICISTVGIYLVRKNTDLLTFSIPEETIQKNNFNQTTNNTSSTQDFLTLKPQTLKVPDEFKKDTFAKERLLNMPDGFAISLFARDLGSARLFDFDEQNTMYLTDSSGRVLILRDTDNNAIAETPIVLESGLRTPHGIDYHNNDLYIATEDSVFVYRSITPDGKFNKKEILISNLPTGGNHKTRTLHIGPDNKLYLAIGSSCNVCEEKDKRRATIMRYNLDGTGEEVFASGLRNTVGFIFLPQEENKYKLLGVDNGRDLIGDSIPPEEVNLIEQGQNYGWPYCYGNKIPNPEYKERQTFCMSETKEALYEMQAHTAPLGIATVTGAHFPQGFANNLIISQHGSWNSSTPVGYRLIRFDQNQSQPKETNFITGWLESSGNIWGRPVAVKFNAQGVLFISDDKTGALYRVTYTVP